MLLLIGCAERNNPLYSSLDYSLRIISQTQTLGWANEVWVQDNIAYIADGEQAVSMWDVSNPNSPTLIDTLQTSAQMNPLKDVDKIAYGKQSNLLFLYERTFAGGLTAYNRTTKQREFSMASGTIDGFAFEETSPDTVVIVVADRSDGILLRKAYFDSVSNYWIADDLGGSFVQQQGIIRNVCLNNDLIFAAHNQLGLTILQVEFNLIGNFPINQIANVNTPGAAYDVALNRAKTHAVVADYQGGVQVIDITNPNEPIVTGSIIPSGYRRAIDCFAVGDTAYFIEQYTSIFAVDISRPNAPELLAIQRLPRPLNLHVTEDHIVYVADEDLGLVILDWRQ